MNLKTDLYINGEWVKGNGTLPVYDPSTGKVIADVQTAGDAECIAAVDAAFIAQKSFAKSAPRARAEILRRAFDIMICLLYTSPSPRDS